MSLLRKLKKRKETVLKKIMPKNYRRLPKWKIGLYYIFYSFIILIFLIIVAFAWFSKDLPTPSKIANRKATESTKIYDRTGQILLYETGEQKRTLVKSDQISNYLKDATIATEDANFYKHHGIDSKAIFSAVMSKITGRTSRTRGASTITQQYVKNALLTSDRSITRKIKEAILAVELEFMFSKDEILTAYLNEIPYGNSTAGAEAAAKMYYGKPAKDLTLAEAATLAAIPKAPTYYSPYGTHTKELVTRKNYVLDRMADTGKVSKEDIEKAKNDDTLALNTTLKPRKESILAPHFAMYVMEKIANQYGDEKIQKEGLKIVTTLDYDKQKIAEQAINDNATKFAQNGAQNAALVAIDPKTGQILAMVGSRDYFNTDIDGNVNVTDSLRQPGSSFKPITYSAAFKKPEFSPSKILFDLETDFGKGYVPKNFNGRFNGPVTVRYALANSLNIPAIKTLSLVGIDNVIRNAEDLGITTLTDRDRYGLSFALGVAEVKPVEMAGAFGVFANNGVKNDLASILKITDSKSKVIYESNQEKKRGRQVLDPQIAYEISSVLSDNNARTPTFGARSSLYFADRPVAVKTGTTQDNKDSWTVGFTPSISVAVWVGNNQPTPMKAGGVMLAGPVFHQFVERSLSGTPTEEFTRPKGIEEVTVEKFSNKLPSELSKETTKDIFASWQVPKEKDDAHIKVKLCKGINKLAPAGMPDEATEEKIFTNIHSERPDYPAWEGPVRAWLQGAGMADAPPTDYCNTSEATFDLSISSPTNNSTIQGEQIITISSTNQNINKVEFFIDNISIGTANSSPFSITYNFNNLNDGAHQISATATSQNNITAKTSITISVVKNGSGPTISNISAINPSPGTTKISWTTNVPSTSQILYKLTESSTYTATSVLPSLVLSHEISITTEPNKTYNYKIISKDGDNEESSSEIKSFST